MNIEEAIKNKKVKKIINYLSVKAYIKLSSNATSETTYSIDDFKQEGYICLIKILPQYKKEKAEFHTFLKNCVERHFKDIINKENRLNYPITENINTLLDSLENPVRRKSVQFISYNSNFNIFFIDKLSSEARLFYNTVFNPPEELKNILIKKSKKRSRCKLKSVVAEHLNFSRHQLKKIKKEIINKAVVM